MIQVFCARRGSGKTKRLIELANHQQISAKGDAVYIDDDSRPMLQLARGIDLLILMNIGLMIVKVFMACYVV